MRVILPYTQERAEVRAAVAATGRQFETRYVGVYDYCYFDLLNVLWIEREDFCVIEHDVVVRPDSLDELDACPNDWCAFGMEYMDVVWPGLSCVRFRAELIARNPDAFDNIAECSDAGHPPRHWCRVDHWLRGELEANGEKQCVHGPPLGHIRPYRGRILPTHTCYRP